MVIKKHIREPQIITLLILCFFLFFTGCGKMNGGTLGNEANWVNGQGQLSEQVGNPNSVYEEVSPPPYYFFDDYIEVIGKTEYNMPTSRWFIHDDEGEFGYGLPSGPMKAGAAYAIKIFPKNNESVKIDRNIRIQLTTRSETYERSELMMEDIIHVDAVIGEEEIYFNQLPKEENVICVLSVEILDQQNRVEDTMVSMMYVPTPEINALLTTDNDVYEATKEQVQLTLKNYGPTHLSIGEYYTIEKKVNDDWKVVPLDVSFPDIGILINIHDTFDQIVAIDQLTIGEYRVIKTINADGLDLSATLAAEFSVE